VDIPHLPKLAPRPSLVDRLFRRQPTEQWSERTIESSPPWLASLVLHALILLILAFWVTVKNPAPTVQLLAEILDVPGDQLVDETAALEVEQPNADEQAVAISTLPEVADPFAAPPEIPVSAEGTVPDVEIQAPQIGLALTGRDEGSRHALVLAYGGNGQSEEAVLRGLKWLAKQQDRKEGSWSLTGPYPNGGGPENRIAATAMALLAFQGAGHTHQKGSFQKHVRRGMEFLLSVQDDEGNFYRQGPGNAWFYTHGQCTIAICELYAMTRDPELAEPAAAAIRFAVETQDGQGGWRYSPKSGSDTSVTGWVMMGLQSGRMAGLDVPQQTLYRVSDWLDSVASDNGSRYAYQPQHRPEPAMTAEGLLCRQYLGWGQYDPRLIEAALWLTSPDNLPSYADYRRDVYYWYYATQFLHHLQGEHWSTWNNAMRDLLVKRQETKGKDAGSWHPLIPEPDRWGSQGGRLYVTCLSLYILEVYYRHLPLYAAPQAAPHVAPQAAHLAPATE